jgi:hypothetical protein
MPGTGPQIVGLLGSPNGGRKEDHLGATQTVNHSADVLGVQSAKYDSILIIHFLTFAPTINQLHEIITIKYLVVNWQEKHRGSLCMVQTHFTEISFQPNYLKIMSGPVNTQYEQNKLISI